MTASLRISASLASDHLDGAGRLRPQASLNSFHTILEHQGLDSLQESEPASPSHPAPRPHLTRVSSAAQRRSAPAHGHHQAASPKHEDKPHSDSNPAAAPLDSPAPAPDPKAPLAAQAAPLESDDAATDAAATADETTGDVSAAIEQAASQDPADATFVPPQQDANQPAVVAKPAPPRSFNDIKPPALLQNAPAINLLGFTLTDGSEALAAQPAASSSSSEQQSGMSGEGRRDLAEMQADMHAQISNSTPINPNDHVAFEAQLSTDASAAAVSNPASPSAPQAELESQTAVQAGLKAIASAAGAEPNASSDVPAAKPGSLFQDGAAPASFGPTAWSGAPSAQPAAETTPSAPTQPAIDKPPAPLSSPHNIIVKVAGPDDSAGIALRFVERGGNIHLSVRTADANVAQELRGGLHELIGSLQHAGIHAEVSTVAAHSRDASQSQDHSDSQDHSGGRGNSGNGQPGSQNQQQNPRDSRSFRWMETLDAVSVRTPFSFTKEQNS